MHLINPLSVSNSQDSACSASNALNFPNSAIDRSVILLAFDNRICCKFGQNCGIRLMDESVKRHVFGLVPPRPNEWRRGHPRSTRSKDSSFNTEPKSEPEFSQTNRNSRLD